MVYDRDRGGSTFSLKVGLGLLLNFAGVLASAASAIFSTNWFTIDLILLVASLLLTSFSTASNTFWTISFFISTSNTSFSLGFDSSTSTISVLFVLGFEVSGISSMVVVCPPFPPPWVLTKTSPGMASLWQVGLVEMDFSLVVGRTRSSDPGILATPPVSSKWVPIPSHSASTVLGGSVVWVGCWPLPGSLVRGLASFF